MAIKKITWIECTCEKCGYVWKPKTENPAMCPECKSARWNEPRKEKKS